jgi:hypothetical protein
MTRLTVVFVALCCLFLTALTPVSAQVARLQVSQMGLLAQVQRGRFVGEVTALTGPTANPTGLTLQLGIASADVRFGTQYTPHPLSAEAEIEGISVHDYASVVVRRVKSDWVAQRVDFDVEPFGHLKLVSATVVSMTADAKHLRVRLTDTGQNRAVALVKQTLYEADGKPLTGLPQLVRDQPIQVLVVRGDFGWVAATLNLKSASGL